MAKKIESTTGATPAEETTSTPTEQAGATVEATPTDEQPTQTPTEQAASTVNLLAAAINKAAEDKEAKTKAKLKVTKMEHGLTERDRREILLRRQSNDVDTIPANKGDKIQDTYFKKDFDGYTIPKHERFHYHVALEDRSFNGKTGKRESYAHVQIFDAVTWNKIKNDDTIKSKTVEIVHDPTLEDPNAELVSYAYTKE